MSIKVSISTTTLGKASTTLGKPLPRWESYFLHWVSLDSDWTRFWTKWHFSTLLLFWMAGITCNSSQVLFR